MASNLGRFTQRTRRVLKFANDTAKRLNHTYIGPEHILVGLVREEDGVAGAVLLRLGATPTRVVRLVERQSGVGRAQAQPMLELAPRAKQILEFAVEEAKARHDKNIDTEHLLLGLLRQNDGPAIDVLRELGLAPDDIRRQMEVPITEQRPNSPAPSPSAPPWAQAGEVRRPAGNLGLTPASQRVLQLANDEAQRLGHDQIRPEHLLLGLVREDNRFGGQMLREWGVTPERVTDIVTRMTGPSSIRDTPGSMLPISKTLLQVLAYAVEESRALRHDTIDPGHLLLGLIRESDSVHSDMLRELGLIPDQIRRETLRAAIQRETGQSPDTTHQGETTHASVPAAARRSNLGRFNQSARRVLQLADDAAARLQQRVIGSQHILIGLVQEQVGVGGRVLRRMGLTPESVIEQAGRFTPAAAPGVQPSNKRELAPQARQVIEYSVEETVRNKDAYVGTDHLLLGLLRQPDGPTIDLLRQLDLTPEAVRAETLRAMKTYREPLDA